MAELAKKSNACRSKGRPGEKKDNIELFLLALPALLKVFVFSYLPIAGIVIAFKNINYVDGIFGSPWVGLKNFEFFFKSADASKVTINTIVMNFLFIVTGMFFGVLMSLLMYRINQCRKALKVYQTTMFFPYFISWVVVGILLTNIIGPGGFVDGILKIFGKDPVLFYENAKYWRPIMVITNLWKTLGYFIVVYYAVLVGLDESQYEAAYIDGANNWHIMIKLQIPYLMPMIALNTLMAIGNIFRGDFGMFYFLPGASNTMTLATTDIIDTYVYRAITSMGNLSMGAAVGLYQSFVGLILITIANKIAKKADPTYGIY